MTDSRPAILFDVDGTLVDTNYLHTLAWWRALQD
nr:HAD family hydrolase [Acidimicrobiia bacterium]